MPEGPECAVVVDELQDACGQIFLAAEVVENEPDKEHRFSKKPIENWDKLQQPWFIDGVHAKGKLIIFDIVIISTGEKWTGLSTLGMSGDWRFDSGGHKHCRLSFIHDLGDLSFIDVRCFGTFRLMKPEDAKKAIDKIGWDLLKSPLTNKQAMELFDDPKIQNRVIGELLLDQTFISSIGNIYRAEILYATRIDPRTLIKDIPSSQLIELVKIGHEILKKAYELRGCSISDFTANGKEGNAQQILNIYGKSRCPAEHNVEKFTQKFGSTERTIWWCPHCVRDLEKKQC